MKHTKGLWDTGTKIKPIPKMQIHVNCINTYITFLSYLSHKLSHFVWYLLCLTLQISSLLLQSEGLVLHCPSSCNDSNSLMLMVCLSLSSCWDHQPTSCGHSLALRQEGPWTRETDEKDREKKRGRAKDGSGLMHVEHTLRQIGIPRQKGPVDKRGFDRIVCMCVSH